MDPYVGEIRICSFPVTPRGWARCDGQLLPISTNQALFSLLGTMYGGNGVTSFALPDLRGRVPLGHGGGHTQGEAGGQEAVTLSIAQMPSHAHGLRVGDGEAVSGRPSPGYEPARGGFDLYSSEIAGLMDPTMVQHAGGSQEHPNMQPYLGLNFIIALQGVYPSRS